MDTYVYFFEGRLYINLTNKCCNDCTFCLRNNMDGIDDNNLWLSKEGTKEEIVELIKQNTNFTDAVFCGYGESTYRVDDMVYIADFLHSIGKTVRLDTNGLGNLINGYDIVPKLKGRIDMVSVSLNEADDVEYDRVSRSIYGTDAYSAMLAFTKECIEAGIKAKMTVVDVIDKEHIEKCRKICEDMGAVFRVREYIK